MAAFIKLAGVVGCSVVLNKRTRGKKGKEHGERAYPALRFPTRHGRKPSQPHIPLGRLAVDAPAGQKVVEVSDDYRDQRADNLALAETAAASSGREDTVRELLEIFKLLTSIGKPMPFGIATYEALLRQVLRLQDKQRGLL